MSQFPKVVDIRLFISAIYFQSTIQVYDFRNPYLRDISMDDDEELRRITVESPTINPVAVRHQRRLLEYKNHQRAETSGSSFYLYSEGTRVDSRPGNWYPHRLIS